MPEEIVLHPNTLLALSAFVVSVGAAFGYFVKAAKPLIKPFQRLQKEFNTRHAECRTKKTRKKTATTDLFRDIALADRLTRKHFFKKVLANIRQLFVKLFLG